MNGRSKKHALTAFILLSAMICGGCGKTGGGILQKAPDISVPFGSDIKVQAGELEFEGRICRRAAGIWSLEITAPETLDGLCIGYDDASGVTAKLDDISFAVPAENIRDDAVFALMFKAMDCAAAAGELPCRETEDGRVYSGEFSGGAYTLTFDPETAVLTRIEIPYGEIAGEFANFEVSDETGEEEVIPEENEL